MLDSMQKGGFVTREADEENRRCERIQITDRGRAAYGAWEGFCGEMEQQMLTGFTDQERTQFADYLGRAYRNLKEGGESGT